MPLEEELNAGVVTPFGDPSPSFQPKFVEPKPARSLFAATMQKENEIISSIVQGTIHNDPSPGFSLQQSLQKRKMEHLYDELAWVNNEAALDRAIASKTRQEESARIIEQAPWWQALPLGVFAGILSPTTLMPGGGLVRSVKGGFSIAKTAGVTAAWAGAGVATQEALLHATQSERTLSESLVNVAGGVILGGLLGGGVAAAMNKTEAKVAQRALTRIFNEAEQTTPSRVITPIDDVEKELIREKILDAGYTDQEVNKFLDVVKHKTALEREEDLASLLTAEDFDVTMKGLEDEAVITAAARGTTESPVVKALADGADDVKVAQVEEAVSPEAPLVGRAAGADVVPETLTRADFDIAGGKVHELAKVGRQFFPGLRLSYSPFQSARKLFNELTGSNLYTNANRQGIALAPGGSAFDQMRVEYGRLFNNTLNSHIDNYRNMKRAGINMSWHEYDSAVGQALRRKDQGANKFIADGAKLWRDSALTPMLKLMQDIGALPAEVKVQGAESYFPRSHNVDLIKAYQGVFEERLLPHALGTLETAYAEGQEKLTKRIQTLQREIELISLDKRGRELELASIEQQIETFGQYYPKQASAYQQLEEVRERLKDKTLAPDVKAQLIDDKNALVEFLKGSDYENALRRMKQDRKLLNLSAGKMEEKADALIERLEKLHEEQMRQTQRLIDKGKQFERESNRLDPAKWDEKRNEVLEAFKEREKKYWEAAQRLEQEDGKLDAERQALVEKTATAVEGAKTNLDAIKAQQAELAKFDKSIGPIKKRIEAQKKRIQAAEAQMARINSRLAALDEFDEEAVLAGFKLAMEELQHDMANSMMFRGMRAQRMLDKLEELSPDVLKAEIEGRRQRISRLQERFEDKWNKDRLAKPDLKGWAKAMVRDYFDAVTGVKYDKVEDYANYTWPNMVGPLKGRANWFPEDVLTEPLPGVGRGFLNDEASHVMNHYLRVMAGDVALRRTFGNISLRPQLDELSREFDELKDAVIAAKTTDEIKKIAGDTGIKFGKDVEKNRQRALQFLDVQHKTNQEDLQAIRDRTLGRYKVEENSSNFGRFVRATNQLNYMRLMGGVVLSSLTEIYRPAMVQGFRPFLQHIVAPMLGDIEALKLGVKEARMLGLVRESVAHNRLYDMAELSDPFAQRTGIERIIDNGTSIASRWSGLAAWTDLGQAQAAVLTQARILEGITKGTDTEYLRFLNIDAYHAKTIREMFKKYGEVRSGVYLANPDRWLEGLGAKDAARVEQARMALWSAIRKEVDSIIVMQSAGDLPLFASTPMGKSILQFRSYNMSAHQKVMLRGLQEGPARFMSGLATMTLMGMSVAALQAWRGGEERWKKFKQSAANPGFLIGEGLDRSGIFPLLFDVGHATDTVARTMGKSFNPVKTPMLWPFPQESQAGDQTRWALGQGAFGLLGPTANYAMRDLPRAGGAALKALYGQNLTKSERKAMGDALMYQNYPGLNWILQTFEENGR